MLHLPRMFLQTACKVSFNLWFLNEPCSLGVSHQDVLSSPRGSLPPALSTKRLQHLSSCAAPEVIKPPSSSVVSPPFGFQGSVSSSCHSISLGARAQPIISLLNRRFLRLCLPPCSPAAALFLGGCLYIWWCWKTCCLLRLSSLRDSD